MLVMWFGIRCRAGFYRAFGKQYQRLHARRHREWPILGNLRLGLSENPDKHADVRQQQQPG
jgi:hypothetical protein